MEQRYELYTPEEHETWHRLYRRMLPNWKQYANPRFLEGLDALGLDERIPRLTEINRQLSPLTGFKADGVEGYLPAFEFFDRLRRREFPTTLTIRSSEQLDYLPEPDIFHDIAGHVPMHTDPAFANALVKFGECANEARHQDREALPSIIRAMARFFWFTVEFGLMNTRDGLRAYGSGLLSSHGELEHSLLSPNVQRSPIQLEWAIHQSFEIDRYQPLLFVVEGFDHLFALVEELRQWMLSGKLNNVAPGSPHISAADLQSFLVTRAA